MWWSETPPDFFVVLYELAEKNYIPPKLSVNVAIDLMYASYFDAWVIEKKGGQLISFEYGSRIGDGQNYLFAHPGSERIKFIDKFSV